MFKPNKIDLKPLYDVRKVDDFPWEIKYRLGGGEWVGGGIHELMHYDGKRGRWGWERGGKLEMKAWNRKSGV